MIRIPQDMQQPELAEKFGCDSVVSIRDMLILLGATDGQLRDMDEKDEILEREPWRTANRHFEVTHESPDGTKFGFMRGEVDWSGTRFAK